MKYLRAFGIIALASMLASPALADYTDTAPSYVDNVPLADVISASPQSCGAQSTLQLPMIDWSGDFPTVYGNGGVTTDPDSLFALMEVDAQLYVQNDLVRQAEDFLSCASPFMRVTQGQAMMLAPVMQANDATNMVAIYKHSFSLGDHLVARDTIKTPADLCSANIAIMRYGPHVDFLGRILSDAGCDISAMQAKNQIKWVENLTGPNSPYHALVSDPDVSAAFVVTPDMIALIDEGHVPGAHALVSTRALSRLISDIYVVRKDFFLANKDRVQNLVHALFLAGEEFQGLMAGLGQSLAQDPPSLTGDQQVTLDLMAKTFESVPDAVEGGWFWLDADLAGYPGNVKWATETNPRGWLGLNNEVQASLASLGLSDRAYTIGHAAWTYADLSEGLDNTSGVEQPVFDVSAVAALMDQRRKQGALDTGELFRFEIFFQADQNAFGQDQYAEDFKELLNYAQAYGGAIITVEGHSDPLGYLMAKDPARFNKPGEPASKIVLRRQVQALRNLSATRGTAARDALIEYARDVGGVSMDMSQFTIIAMGIDDPKSGKCGADPCAPATEAEWLSNMRVVFRIIAVPTESGVFVAAKN